MLVNELLLINIITDFFYNVNREWDEVSYERTKNGVSRTKILSHSLKNSSYQNLRITSNSLSLRIHPELYDICKRADLDALARKRLADLCDKCKCTCSISMYADRICL